ncbi:hypothetical protein [Paraburkholderia saeva]|uniref:Uncharacterized protein n=1 Tax=Paraburkholderia saeva TaxID=2777537 RepID=A0A9N8RYG5_9BURK|nr:hypothetical protein [Paraburkholderia saeva]CAG4905802.1 hypothetical protein LMG31841_03490 [Paraburkholderia saeva]CAG4909454.1 hypothetical protein R70241_03723 [Paraburkholderia saeva]CAG4921800.1 hypothetical protein R52603_05003 [Paraburkholderia saeva]
MARTKETRANAAPGAGTVFALRAIGLVILARWLFSMSDMGFGLATLRAMASSPWVCINLVFLFLIIFLPGARARAERPFHPLPQWLRQALRLFALLGFVFAVWSVGAFVWVAGWRRAVGAIAATNGWLVAAPALYAAVMWICRPRALWRTNTAARRYAIGRYAVALDLVTRTAVVWVESRKLGQYDSRELSVRWPDVAGADAGQPPAGVAALATEPSVAGVTHAAVATPVPRMRVAAWWHRPKVELLWDSPAAAGHNRQTVFRAPLLTEGDRVAARALDSMLRQV